MQIRGIIVLFIVAVSGSFSIPLMHSPLIPPLPTLHISLHSDREDKYTKHSNKQHFMFQLEKKRLNTPKVFQGEILEHFTMAAQTMTEAKTEKAIKTQT